MRALTPFTRDAERDTGEVVREFDLRSAAVVIGAFIGVAFLIFFLAAFLPWLLANGMTAAVEGLMHQVGEADFQADTLGDWLFVLLVGGAFTGFIVMIAVGILALYNLISKRTGMNIDAIQRRVVAAPDDRPAIAEPVDDEPVTDSGEDRSFDELYAEAQTRGITGRSSMSKAELLAALKSKRRAASSTTRRR
ncbi:MAG: hypothetical protein EXQ79_06550 [Acidimicrobiia bacterium]|nr:hypothetical protein [Acidimicrobiia bacterium]